MTYPVDSALYPIRMEPHFDVRCQASQRLDIFLPLYYQVDIISVDLLIKDL